MWWSVAEMIFLEFKKKSLKIPLCEFTRPEYWDGLMIVTMKIEILMVKLMIVMTKLVTKHEDNQSKTVKAFLKVIKYLNCFLLLKIFDGDDWCFFWKMTIFF